MAKPKKPKTEESKAYDHDVANRLIALSRAVKKTTPPPTKGNNQ